jgi:copper chaperone CopZ
MVNNFLFIFHWFRLLFINLVVKTVKIKIEGMSDLNSAIQLQRMLSAVPTVNSVGVSIGEAIVEHEKASDEQLLHAIYAAGNYGGKIILPTRRISKLAMWIQKMGKASVNKMNLDSTILPSGNLQPNGSLGANLP